MKTITQVVQNLVKPYIDNQDQAVESNIAPVETDATSSTGSYSQGEQLILNKILYDVTAAITVGDPLEVGTNIAVAPKISAAIGGKQEQIEVSSMPTASASNVGKVLIYIGATTSTYTSGQSYQSTLEGGNYIWKPTSISSVDASDVVYDNQTSRLTATDSQAAIDELASQNQTLENNVDVLFETGVKNICPPYSGSSSANGITYIGNSDGTVTVNGTCSANAGVNIRVYLKAGQYKVSGCPSGGSYSTYRIGVTTDSWTLIGTHDLGNGTTITIPSDGYYRINLDVREGYVANNLVFKPMITDVDTPESDYDHYVPYAKTNQQLTEDSVDWDNFSEVGAVNFLNHTATNLVENGITFTVNADRSITANGTAIAEEWVKIAQNVAVSESVRASGCPKGGTPSTYFMTFSQGDNSNRDYGDGVIVPSGTISSVYLVIKPNVTVNNIVFKPMIAPVSYNGPYVPYAKTNKELTDDVAIKSSEITVNTTNVDSENIVRNYVNKSAGVKVLVLQAIPKTNLVAGTTYELGTVPSDYLPTLSIGFVKEDVVASGGLTALIEVSSGKLKLTPRVNNISTSGSFIVSVTYI